MNLPAPASLPAPPQAPVAEPERIHAIDVLRGVALLGILPVNMISFAHVDAAYQNPSLGGGFEGWDYIVWAATQFFFEGKMITLFSLLFGAGLYLQVSRNEERRGRVGSARGLYLRRVGWLFVIGMLHAYLFWYGDILTHYAVIGFLVYWLRRLRPRWLITLAILLLCLGAVLIGSGSLLSRDSRQYREMERDMNPPAAKVQAEEQLMRSGGFVHLAVARAGHTFGSQVGIFLYYVFWRVTALMLLGIAFIKLDVLTAGRSIEFYLLFAVGGLAIGVPLTGVSVTEASQPFDLHRFFVTFATSEYFGTLFQALAYLGLVMIAVKLGVLRAVQTRLAAVGRMALTNYLTHTLIGTFVFNGWGLGQFGLWSRTQQALLVLGIWAFQLIVSPVWLRYFQFGPVEWLWRTLTYLRPQPFRRVVQGESA